MRERTDADYEALADSYEAEPVRADEVRRPIEAYPNGRRRLTDAEYAEMAADYEANPPGADEIAGPIEVDAENIGRARETPTGWKAAPT